VGDVQRRPGRQQPVHDPALRRGRRHRRGAAQVERVVGEQQVEAAGHHLVDDRLDRVHREQHPADRRLRVAADQPDGVPVLRQRRRVEALERGDHVGQAGGHGATVRPVLVRAAGRQGAS
jgi:hypothetical protein